MLPKLQIRRWSSSRTSTSGASCGRTIWPAMSTSSNVRPRDLAPDPKLSEHRTGPQTDQTRFFTCRSG
eukprot:scaffold848_cov247-Pinguiococcus_pyrenoidosus.AAC.19